MPRLPALLLCLGLGCSTSLVPWADGGLGVTGGTGGGGSVSSKPPPIDLTVFATSVGTLSTKLLTETSNARLEVDPTTSDALTALGACADAVSYCYAPNERSIGQCLRSTRACTTTEPWKEAPCCPPTCVEAFAAQVDGGASERAALERVLFREPDCFPGVRAALEAP